jgi:hypothetical protein
MGVGVSLLASLAVSGQALAGESTNNSLMCAVYIDITMKDMAPLGAFNSTEMKSLILNRALDLVVVSERNPSGDTMEDFISAKKAARLDLAANSNLNNMMLYSPGQIERYAKSLESKVLKYCPLAKKEYVWLKDKHAADPEVLGRKVEIMIGELMVLDAGGKKKVEESASDTLGQSYYEEGGIDSGVLAPNTDLAGEDAKY